MEKRIISLKDVSLSLETLLDALSLDKDDDTADEIAGLLDEANKIVKPVAVYSPFKPVFCDGKIILNEIGLKESFIYEMILTSPIAIPYAVTCGLEIDKWSKTINDYFNQFVAETIKQLYLKLMVDELFTVVKGKFFEENTYLSTINPGSLKEWPLSGQVSLFKILGDVKNDIGVTLEDNFFMTPAKSVSGIIFQTDEKLHNCKHCLRADCPDRRTSYIEDLMF